LLAFSQELKPIQLPQPKLDQNKSLTQALQDRKTTRKYHSSNLSEQTLSNLLWAEFGINRPVSGKRIVLSAHHWWEIDIYVATAAGLSAPRGYAVHAFSKSGNSGQKL
jgi:hypothetical protein